MTNTKKITGTVYVVGDNIDTDQIIPARYLSLVPTIPEEYKRLGQYALSGLPSELYPERLTDSTGASVKYAIIIAGRNFGCGSSREHAPVALGAAGIQAVVAESFARIFYRNCIATGELYPIECRTRLLDTFQTGDQVEVDLTTGQLKGSKTSEVFTLQPLGDAETVVAVGGLFAYARKTGLVGSGSGSGSS